MSMVRPVTLTKTVCRVPLFSVGTIQRFTAFGVGICILLCADVLKVNKLW